MRLPVLNLDYAARDCSHTATMMNSLNKWKCLLTVSATDEQISDLFGPDSSDEGETLHA